MVSGNDGWWEATAVGSVKGCKRQLLWGRQEAERVRNGGEWKILRGDAAARVKSCA